MAPKLKLNMNRTKAAFESRDKKGGGGSGLKDDILAYSKMTGASFYKAVAGGNKIDIIPFIVKSDKHPLVADGTLDIGDLDFMLDLWVHRKVGPNEATIVCPKHNYGKKCPVCDLVHEYYEAGDTKSAKLIQKSRRALMNVRSYEKGEPQPPQIWNVSHYLFAKDLLEEANESGVDEEMENFADLEDGSTISFRGTATGINDSLEFKSIKFITRDEEVTEEMVKKAFSFDEYLILYTAEQIEAIMYGETVASSDEDEKPAKTKAKSDPIDEEEEDEKPAPRKKPAPKVDEEEEEDLPKPPAKKAPAKPKDEEEEDEAPPRLKGPLGAAKPAAKAPAKSGGCPSGHTFGADCDRKPECKKCPHWDDCNDAA